MHHRSPKRSPLTPPHAPPPSVTISLGATQCYTSHPQDLPLLRAKSAAYVCGSSGPPDASGSPGASGASEGSEACGAAGTRRTCGTSKISEASRTFGPHAALLKPLNPLDHRHHTHHHTHHAHTHTHTCSRIRTRVSTSTRASTRTSTRTITHASLRKNVAQTKIASKLEKTRLLCRVLFFSNLELNVTTRSPTKLFSN